MRVLMLSTDANLLDKESAVAKRHICYGKVFFELHIIVRTLHTPRQSIALAENVFVYPTGSFARLFWPFDIWRIASRLPLPSVISAEDPFETGFIALHIARKRKVPLYIQIHTDIISPYFTRLSLLNRLRVALSHVVIPHAQGIRVVTEAIKEGIQKHYSVHAPITVLPIFVATRTIAAEARKKRFTIELVWVGRLRREKNPSLALHALALVRAAGYEAGLVIIGKGKLQARLEQLAEREHLTPWVLFEGWRDPYPYYKSADVLLITSFYEGYGLTAVEALATGLAVIATDVGIARKAGAIIAGENYGASVIEWLQHGRPSGVLKYHPYHTEEEYIALLQKDMEACAQRHI